MNDTRTVISQILSYQGQYKLSLSSPMNGSEVLMSRHVKSIYTLPIIIGGRANISLKMNYM